MRDIIQLSETLGVRIVICTNDETVLEGREMASAGGTKDEIVEDATTEASNVILDRLGAFADTDSFFANWHGGKFDYSRVAYCVGHIIADVYSRDVDGEWEWTNDKLPAELDRKVREALGAADKAHTEALDRWEASAKEDREEIDREEAEVE